MGRTVHPKSQHSSTNLAKAYRRIETDALNVWKSKLHHSRKRPPAEAGDLSCLVLQTLAWGLRLAVLVSAVHAAVAAGWGRSLGFGKLDNHGFGGEKETGDRGCVLECRAGHLGRVDDAGLD